MQSPLSRPPRPVILLAEDDAAFRALVIATLPYDEYELLEARDGDEAWTLILERRPDVAILDVRMPGRSGLDLLQALRTEPSLGNTGVILLTAAVDAPDVAAGTAAGADAYLTKPFSPLQLVGTVRGLIERREPNSQAADRLYWALFEGHPLALLVYDVRTDRHVAVNMAAERLLGRSRDELLQLRPQDLTLPSDTPALAAFLAALSTQDAHTMLWRLVRNDRTVAITEVYASRVAVDERVYCQLCLRELPQGETV